jgi:hypothetical protein
LHDLRIDGKSLEGELLSAHWAAGANSPGDETCGWPAQVADAYVRGGDLVTAYGRMPNWPYAPQLYWRAGSLSMAGAPCSVLSLLVSLQTDSLDSHPGILVASRLAAVEVVELGQTAETKSQALLWRLTDPNWSYLEVVPHSDSGELSIAGDAAGRFTTKWRLFGDFLEKGVIRRAQIHTAFLPREGDADRAAACIQIIARRPLPLTT